MRCIMGGSVEYRRINIGFSAFCLAVFSMTRYKAWYDIAEFHATPHFMIISSQKLQPTPQESTVHWLSFEYSQFQISSTDSNVRTMHLVQQNKWYHLNSPTSFLRKFYLNVAVLEF